MLLLLPMIEQETNTDRRRCCCPFCANVTGAIRNRNADRSIGRTERGTRRQRGGVCCVQLQQQQPFISQKCCRSFLSRGDLAGRAESLVQINPGHLFDFCSFTLYFDMTHDPLFIAVHRLSPHCPRHPVALSVGQDGGRAGAPSNRVAAPQCDCVARRRRQQQNPLTTIKRDYNWDYRLLSLNALLSALCS